LWLWKQRGKGKDGGGKTKEGKGRKGSDKTSPNKNVWLGPYGLARSPTGFIFGPYCNTTVPKRHQLSDGDLPCREMLLYGRVAANMTVPISHA